MNEKLALLLAKNISSHIKKENVFSTINITKIKQKRFFLV